MKLNVLVINPYITDFKLYDEWMHPVGLYFLIDILEKNDINTYYFDFLSPSAHIEEKKFGTGTFHNQQIIKPSVYNSIRRKYKLYGSPEEDFISYIKNIPTPDLICIGSSMTYWVSGVIKTVDIMHKHFPTVPITIGGIASKLLPDYFKSNLPECINSGNLFSESHVNSQIPLLSNLEIDFSNFSILGGIRKLNFSPHGPLLLSLGCPMRCTYCASAVLQPYYKIRNTEIVISEVEYFVNTFNTKDFAFYDDALLYNKDKVLYPFLEKLKKKNFNIRLHTPNGLHVRFVDKESLLIMKETGFSTIRYGYESGNARYQTATSGKITREELDKKISLTLQCGFSGKQVGVYVMGGLPMQTPEDMFEDLEFIHKLGVTVKPVFISPVPGSVLFEEYAKQFPSIRADPLWHNDTFFITNLPFWDDNTLEQIRQKTRTLNSKIN